MALQLAESFDHWGDVYEKYTTVNPSYAELNNSVTRNGTGQSFAIWQYLTGLKIPLPTPAAEVYIGFAIYTNEFFGATQGLLYVNGGSDNVNCSIRGTNSGFHLYNPSTVYLESSNFVQTQLYSWNYFELKIKVSDSTSAGDIQIKRNGHLIYSCSAGLDVYHNTNPNTNISSVSIYGSGTNGQTSTKMYIDDIYICDSSGSTNNTFLGEPGIDVLYPNANGNSSDFMGSDGNQTDNYLLVDDAQETSDTDYVYDDTVDQIDLYGFDSVISGVTVYAVSAEICCRKDDAGSRTGRIMCRSGGTNYEGDEFFPASDYRNYSQIWETDPDTAAAWTETGVNGAEFGVTIES